MNHLAERAVPLTRTRLAGFRRAHGRAATLDEIAAITVDVVLDLQDLDAHVERTTADATP